MAAQRKGTGEGQGERVKREDQAESDNRVALEKCLKTESIREIKRVTS